MTPPETDPLEQLLGDLPAAKPTASDIEHVRDAIEHCNSTTVETSANGEQPVTQHLWLRRITIPQAIAACLVVCIGSVITTMAQTSSVALMGKVICKECQESGKLAEMQGN